MAETIIIRKKYILVDDNAVEFGDPVYIVEDFVVSNIKQYPSQKPIGISIEWRADISGYTPEDWALYGTYDKKRDISILIKGSVTMKDKDGHRRLKRFENGEIYDTL